MKIKLRMLRAMIREALEKKSAVLEDDEDLEIASLDEVDLDPTNNPGRPADAYDYLGMHPKATAAMSHPSLGG